MRYLLLTPLPDETPVSTEMCMQFAPTIPVSPISAPGTDAFLELASEWDQTTFIVTRLGVRRGFSDADIAPLFDRALDLYNVVLPEAYVSILVAARIRDGRSLPGGLQE